MLITLGEGDKAPSVITLRSVLPEFYEYGMGTLICSWSSQNLSNLTGPVKRRSTNTVYNTVKPVLSDHAWAKKKWSLNRGGP